MSAFFCFFLLERKRNPLASKARAARMAMTIPAIAPPDIGLEGDEVAVAEAALRGDEVAVAEAALRGDELAVAETELELEVMDEDRDVEMLLEELPVDCIVEEVVAVTAINLRGSKVYELAAGLTEEREEYNEFKAPLLIFVRVSCAEDQQMFIWPLV
ncbi:hypothetical protein FKW77_007890 [Venturia effusa]|uniref:Uncharacterized protein n=1 Tax=Venturia effusa TaxID=50376 RepID=A0A517LBA7_9PEZI|nr:hypothetical protein FKW77_007890 [Venturia effusa]